MMRYSESRPKRRQRGAMAVLAGVMVVVMLGMGGMVIDLGRMYVTRTELQSAMDACALAASSQLQPGPSATRFRVCRRPTRTVAPWWIPLRPRTRAYFQSRAIEPGDVQVGIRIRARRDLTRRGAARLQPPGCALHLPDEQHRGHADTGA